jgi:hypothetical protein
MDRLGKRCVGIRKPLIFEGFLIFYILFTSSDLSAQSVSDLALFLESVDPSLICAKIRDYGHECTYLHARHTHTRHAHLAQLFTWPYAH